MGEKSDQIEQHIRETRDDLSDNFSELQEKVKTAVDWRTQFEERPGTMIALAFGGGAMLAALLSGGRSSSRNYSGSRRSSYLDRDADHKDYEATSSPSRGSERNQRDQTSETWDALKGALIGAATTKLTSAIEEVLPGFTHEFKSRGGKSSEEAPTPSSSGYKPAQQRSATAGAY